ncbi:ATP-binding cassette domain-containing protein [Rhodococcus sp. ACT016]|uniref:ATP-binding cassette domain-containing protein n=1 Tax=Rhodococcus sp. ACT016 TaxID=3134808 RepID=UPI003D2E6E42
MSVVTRIVDDPALQPQLPRLAAGAACAAVAAGAALVPLVVIVEFVRAPAPASVWGAAGALLAAAVLQAAAAYLCHDAEARYGHALRRRLARHVAHLPMPTLAELSAAGLRARLDTDVTALHHLVAHLPGEIVAMAVIPALSIALLVGYVGPWSLLALIPAVLAAAFHLVVIPRRSRRFSAERTRVIGQITAAVDDVVRGIEVTRIYGDESGASARYAHATTAFARDFRAWVRRASTPAAMATAALQAAATLAVALVVGSGRPEWQVAALLVFSLALVAPVARLGHGLDYVGEGLSAQRRIAGLFAEPLLRESDSASNPVPNLRRAPVLRDVRASLDDTMSLGPVTLRIEPGTFTAITGPSGSGKTTLLRLLGRSVDPSAGAIGLGEIPYEEILLERMADHVVTVPQAPDVLPFTVRANLLVARPEATDGELRDALAIAHLDVPLDAPAERLSGGERQRLAVARAILTTAPVLLLDEPTSALDEATAAKLVASLRALPGRTVVMVTHNSAHAALATVTVRMADGKVVA